MQTKQINTSGAMTRIVGTINLLLNLFWSVLAFLPACVFCYRWVANDLLFLFLGISVLPFFLPRSFFDKLQIANHASPYKKLGISFIQYLTQNGKLANFFIRKRYAGYKVVRSETKSIERLLNQSYINETFHYTALLFFCFLTGFALANGLLWWAFLFGATNLFYNVYPILLQQYIRIKLRAYYRKPGRSKPAEKSHKQTFRLKCTG